MEDHLLEEVLPEDLLQDGGKIHQDGIIEIGEGHHQDEDLRHNEEDPGHGQGHQHVEGDTVDQVPVHPDDFNILIILPLTLKTNIFHPC